MLCGGGRRSVFFVREDAFAKSALPHAPSPKTFEKRVWVGSWYEAGVGAEMGNDCFPVGANCVSRITLYCVRPFVGILPFIAGDQRSPLRGRFDIARSRVRVADAGCRERHPLPAQFDIAGAGCASRTRETKGLPLPHIVPRGLILHFAFCSVLRYFSRR